MKKSPFLLILIFMGLACTGRKPFDVPEYTIEQFYKNISIRGGTFSPDETRILVTSNETGIYNIVALPVDGSDPDRLSWSENESFFAISYFPEDNRILFHADQGGNENDHIYLLKTDGSIMDLTPGMHQKCEFFAWSRDQKSFFYVSNRRDPRYFDLYERPVSRVETPGSETMIYRNTEGLDIGAISPDRTYLALVKNITTTNNELYLYNRKTDKKIHISAHEGDATYTPVFFDTAGAFLYYLTDENSEFRYLEKYNLTSGEKETVYKTGWDVLYALQSWNEKYRIIGVNEDARTVIHVFNVETGRKLKLPRMKGAGISSVNISKSETKFRLTVSAPTSPADIYVYDLDTGMLNRLTHTLNPEIEESHLVAARVIRYPSWDGLQIPAIYYEPHTASKSARVPALIWVHGGPGGQSRTGYSSLIQYLVNHGYAVLAVNNRGSSGYGRTFYKLDDKRHGEDDLKDCIYAKRFLSGTGVIDPDRIGIIGGSYGGYMVMAALAFAPEEFAAGVNIFGVTNWLRTLKSIPPYWESFRRALYEELGDPFSPDSVRLRRISPLFHAGNVIRPLMVLQGANDVRVIQAESDDIVKAVKANNVPVEYIVFDDEGHGFRKKENEIEGYREIRLFLDKYLKAGQATR